MDGTKIEMLWAAGIAPDTAIIIGSRYADAADGVFADEQAVADWLLGFAAAAGSPYRATLHGDMERAFTNACTRAKQGQLLRTPAEAWARISGGTAPTPTPTPEPGDSKYSVLLANYENLKGQYASLEGRYQQAVDEAAYWKDFAEKLSRGEETPLPLPDGSLPGPGVYGA